MKRYVKIVFRTLAYTGVFLLLWFYVGFVLTPKRYDDLGGDYYFAYQSIFKEKANTIDVMFSGNSNTFKSCIPIEFYHQTGATCYNIGGSKQSATAMEARIKDVLKRQTPKLLIIDADCLYASNKYYTGSNTYRTLTFTAPIFYHHRWTKIKWTDFFRIPRDDQNFWKGYVMLTDVYGYQIPDDYMRSDTQAIKALAPSVRQNMQNIYQLCQDKGVQILFISAPTPATWTNEKHNGIQQLADEFGVSYLDLNMPDVEFGFDYAIHIADNGYHCNLEGGKLVTKYVADYVNAHYNLADRRLDPAYARWNEQYQQYTAYIGQI